MTIWNILLAILVFGILIFVHELGHFIVAKWAGIKVLEFAIGMGPTIFKRQRGDTVYAIRALPIGGFVAMEGEDGEESTDSRCYQNAPIYKRALVMAAGAAMNLLLGLILLGVLSAQAPLLGTTQVAMFYEDSVSSQALQVGDTILKVNGHRVRTDNDLVYEFQRERDGVMDMVVRREGVEGELALQVPFRMDAVEGDDSMQMIYLDFKVLGVEPTFGGVVRNSFNWTCSMIKQVWGSLIDLVTGRFGLNQLSGPVGVTEVIGQATSNGSRSFLTLVSLITINLGVFNLLPFPALDGGKLIFLLIELIRRKPANPKVEGYINAAGLVLLFGLMIGVTVNDVFKLFTR